MSSRNHHDSGERAWTSMIMINLFENDKNVTIEVTGHGDDTDQSCARVSTFCDCIQLFYSKIIDKAIKEYGYTCIKINKVKMYKKGLSNTFYNTLSYLIKLEQLYRKSIKIVLKGESKNGKNN